jgi:hypothetical protein
MLLGILYRDLRLPYQARHVHKARRPATVADSINFEGPHETLLCVPMKDLRADVALVTRLDRTRHVTELVTLRDGLRDGLLVFFVGVVLLRVAAAVDTFTNLLVAAPPVVMLASGVTIARLTSNTARRVVGQWGGAGGAICEDHFALVWGL